MNIKLKEEIAISVEKINYLYKNILSKSTDNKLIEIELLKQYCTELYDGAIRYEHFLKKEHLVVPSETPKPIEEATDVDVTTAVIATPAAMAASLGIGIAAKKAIKEEVPIEKEPVIEKVLEETPIKEEPVIENTSEEVIAQENLIDSNEFKEDISEMKQDIKDIKEELTDPQLPTTKDLGIEEKIETPVFEAPKAETPTFETPKVEAPAFGAPKVEVPVFETPKVENPMPAVEKTVEEEVSSLKRESFIDVPPPIPTQEEEILEATKTAILPNMKSFTNQEKVEGVAEEKNSKEIELNEILGRSRSSNGGLWEHLSANKQSQKFEIGMNQRLVFIRELFDSEEDVYEETLQELAKCKDFISALAYLNLNIKMKYKWGNDNETAREFCDIVKRRF